MSDSALPDSVLTSTVQTVARMLGDRLPAAFDMEAGDVVVAGAVEDHAMPEEAVAVRWLLGPDEASLVVALTPDAAEQLRTGPPERSLPEALAVRIAATLEVLAALFEGITPDLGEGEEIPVDQALADGPGDAVSVTLSDGGTHRATVAIRMIVSDELLASLAPSMVHEDEVGLPAAGDYGTDLDPEEAPADPSPVAAPQPMAAPQPEPAPAVVGAAASSAPRTRQAAGPAPGTEQAEAHPADFASFDQLSALPGAAHSMAMLGEVEMGVTAELGRTRLTVRDVLGLNPGSIIELDRSAGSPVDVVVNGTLIARGEVVVIDEEFGIRVTEILGMAEEVNPFPLQAAQ